MFNNIKLIIFIIIIMFSIFSKSHAKYEKFFFDLNIRNNDGSELNLSKFKGKTVLLVNVASNCGFTKQYDALQFIFEKYKSHGFFVIAVPSNQFGNQEPGNNDDIKNFCETNFNITFPITDKVEVKGSNSHLIYKWAKENHGNSAVPKWNFHKILINKKGEIEDTYGSFIKPDSKKITSQIEKILFEN